MTAARPHDGERHGTGPRAGVHRGQVVETENARDEGSDVARQGWFFERGIVTRAVEQDVVDLDAERPLDRADVAGGDDQEAVRKALGDPKAARREVSDHRLLRGLGRRVERVELRLREELAIAR